MHCRSKTANLKSVSALALLAALAACGQRAGSQAPGDSSDTQPFAGIAADEVLQLTGTEPFWGGEIAGNRLTYTTAENPEGMSTTVKRFAGRGGISFSGEIGGTSLDMMVTPAQCSDGMSDRTYPFVVSLKLGEDVRNGCAWSKQHPYTGDETP